MTMTYTEKAIQLSIDGGWVREVPIVSKGKRYTALVGCLDYPLVNKHTWSLTQKGYAITTINYKRIRMHHLILGKPPEGKVTDHINRKRLDNRRSNLRFVSIAQNGFNTTAVGVRQRGNSWEANLCVNYHKHFKGGFKTKEEALEWRSYLKNQYAKTVWI